MGALENIIESMTLKNKIIAGAALAYFTVMALVLLFAFTSTAAHANPSVFARAQWGQPCTNASAVATSTYNSISLGLGTTTVTYCASGANSAADSAVLDIQFNASTTAPVLGVRIEHSYDGIDWYADVPLLTSASSTNATYTENQISFSTSTGATNGFAGSGTANRGLRDIPITTPTRFTRAVIFGVTGSGSVYAEIVAKQQVQ